MKILVVHNRYQNRAGEDSVFDKEVQLLQEHGNLVTTWTVDNRDIHLRGVLSQLYFAFNTVWSMSSYQTMRQKLREFQPDIVHVHNTLPLLSPAIFYASIAEQVPVIQTLHNYRLACPVGTFFRDGKVCESCLQFSLFQSIRYCCYRQSRLQTATVAIMLQVHRWLQTWQRVVDGYIALSQFQYQKLVEIGIPAHKIYLKPNFIEKITPIKNLDNFGSYYLYVGRLTAAKGIQLLLEGYSLANSNFPLILIGSGELESIVVQAAENNPLIRYVGQQSNPQVLEWMQGAIALIFPSIWYECLPTTILEAYSCSLPVIAADFGSVNEVVKPQKTGLLFSPLTPQTLATTIKQLEEQPQHWINLKTNLINVLNPLYFADLNYQKLVQIYQQTIKSRQIS